jgi:DNA-binding MarR family transcriptional regulator
MRLADIAEEIVLAYARLYLFFYRRRDPRAYRPRPEALAVMEHLASTGPLTILEAARHLDRSPSAVSEHVDRLMKRGLLLRIPDERDRRRHLVWLSSAGRALLEEERQVLSTDLLTRALEQMPRVQQENLISGLNGLVKAAKLARRRSGSPRTRRKRNE